MVEYVLSMRRAAVGGQPRSTSAHPPTLRLLGAEIPRHAGVIIIYHQENVPSNP